MIHPLHCSSPGLHSQDFLLLGRQFARETAKLLPMQSTPLFFLPEHGLLPPESAAVLPAGLADRITGMAELTAPQVLSGVPVIPLVTGDSQPVVLVLGGLDPALAEKMDPQWLAGFGTECLAVAAQTKMAYAHAETGLYNSHLLGSLLGDTFGRRTLMLVTAAFRSRRASAAMARTIQVARLLQAAAPGVLFYFGSNLFGIFLRGMDRQQSLAYARRLLGRLKREGLQSAHIGIAVDDRPANAAQGEDKLTAECWSALEEAEKRAPFSLCEASSLLRRESHPLARPAADVLRQLRRKWSGAGSFGLVLFRLARDDDSPLMPLAQLIASCQGNDHLSLVAVSDREVYAVLRVQNGADPGGESLRLARAVQDAAGRVRVDAGIACWPCLKYNRTDTAVNCRKALLHGSFFGPGAVTVFDRISLNVSGDYYFDEGDYRSAVHEYRAGLQLDGGDVNLLNSLGVALAELNRHREAIHAFDRVLERDDNNFMALINRGLALRMLGRRDEALLCFEKAAGSREFHDSPVFADISLQLGKLCCEAGCYDRAVDVLEQLTRQDSDRQPFSLHRLLGEAYSGTGEVRKGISALQQALRSNPHDAGAMSILGWLYAEDGQGDDIALSLCRRAVELDQADWRHWYRLGLVRFQTGDPRGALAAASQSLRRSPRQVEVLLLAARINRELGRTKRAKDLYSRVLKFDPDNSEGEAALEELAASRREGEYA